MSEKADQGAALERIRRRVTAVGGLPTLPHVAAELLRRAHDPETSIKDIAQIVSKDPPLTGRLLKVANSAFYGLSTQVGSLSVALVLLGMKNIINVVTSVSVFKTMQIKDGTDTFTRQAFWEHAGACGKACEMLGKRLKLDLAGEGFVAGLVHDLGKIVLDAVFHDDFVQALAMAREHAMPSHEAERSVLGADHAAIGAWLAETWKFPPVIVQAIARHHDSPQDPAGAPLAAALHAANEIVKHCGLGFKGFSPPPAREALAELPLFAGRVLDWDEFLSALHREFDGVKAFLQAAA